MTPPDARIGAWLVGAFGSLATTAVVGGHAVAKGLVNGHGLLSESPEFAAMKLPALGDLVFGGHEIRATDYRTAGSAIAGENGSLRTEWIDALAAELDAASRRIRPGIAAGGGAAIEQLADSSGGFAERTAGATGRACVERLAADLREFRERERLAHVVVVNLASTEPPPPEHPAYATRAALESTLDREPAAALRPGTLYAYAALQAGAAFVNFTASGSCLCPAIEEVARANRLPYMGNDGKTGETLVKSALAPMFRARRLDVMSWVGFNILGNRDGQVLAADANKRSKVGSKDSVLPSIFGYPLRTHVGIDYVESLGDSKVAWDFIHFRGFLGHPMTMQFTWQGCDSILAAPLVLDLVRFASLALQRGASGPLDHLASFFKSPLRATTHDFHRQYALLEAYAREVASARET